MELILDTSFILTCLKEGIDFLEAEEFGSLVLPLQVIEEIDKVKEKPGKEGELADLALDIIEKNKNKFKIVDLGKKFADAGIKRYVKGKKVVVATIDRELKRELRGRVSFLVIRARKKLEIV